MGHKNGFMAEAMAAFLPQVRLPPPSNSRSQLRAQSIDTPWTVILTGSTGSIGTHVLAALQRCPADQVCRVFCLNRSANAKERQQSALADRGLPPLDSKRFIFLKADFTMPGFGMEPQILEQLRDEATVIIHNAWTVNFLLPGEKFVPNLVGLRNLLHFSYESPNHPPVLFVSSLGIAYASEIHHIEEVIYHDLNMDHGYSESKYVAEKMLEAYALSTRLPVGVIRVGQVAGPIHCNGIWPAREWFPTMLRAARHIGYLPATLGKHNDIDWIPVDIISRIIVEITEYVMTQTLDTVASRQCQDAWPPLVFNVANPATVPFEDLVPHLALVAVNKISGEEWTRLLEMRAAERPTPGAKLVGFYKGILARDKPVIATDTHNLRAASKTARALTPVNRRWVLRWLDQWGYRSSSITSRL